MDPADAHQIEAALRAGLAQHLDSREVELEGRPERLYGGNQSWVWSFALRGAKRPFDGPLVLRILRPHMNPATVHREACIHDALRSVGYPAPAVLLHSRGGEPFGRPYQIIPRLSGRPMMLGDVDSEDMNRLRTLWMALPELGRILFGTWPEQLATLQRRLHTIDPAHIVDALSRAGLDPDELGLMRLVEQLRADVEGLGLAGLGPALDWLQTRIPDTADVRLCHGDFFPNQVFIRDGEVEGVIDWSEATFAPVEFEVGVVVAGLATLPAPTGPPLRAWLRRLARRYQSAYDALHPLDPECLRWAEAYRCTAVLVSVARNRAARAGSATYHEIPHPYDSATGVRLPANHRWQKTGRALSLEM